MNVAYNTTPITKKLELLKLRHFTISWKILAHILNSEYSEFGSEKKSRGAFNKEKSKVKWPQVSNMNGYKKITSEIEFHKSTKNCVCKLCSTFRIMFLNIKLGRLNNISTSTEHNIIKTLKESGEISVRKWQSTSWSLGKVENCSVLRVQ